MARAAKESEHFVREKPAYVHWRYEPPVGRKPGKSTAVLVCPAPSGNGLDFFEENRRRIRGAPARQPQSGPTGRSDKMALYLLEVLGGPPP